jgi:S-adenosylmethionine:tRNA ribosyltransferase-isomerase
MTSHDRLSDFDFDLPEALIAQHPAAHRTESRLLVVAPKASVFQDARFTDLIDQLEPGDLMVFNNSKVIPARLFGQKASGGQVEILVERISHDHQALAMLRVSKKPAPGSQIQLNAPSGVQGPVITVLGRDATYDDRFVLQFPESVLDVLHRCGELPLPPYIQHKPDQDDANRYQTVYAQTPGSVAAPTAGLHFDEPFLARLDAKGIRRAFVTLHVGTGTFAPVRTEDLSAHQMHSEWYELPVETANAIAQARLEGRRVIAVGTTSLRTLESAAMEGGLVVPGQRETDIFIRPGYSFKVVDALLTNFHLPKSTLLMLVAAFVGYDTMRKAYTHAVKSQYRFFSYGDAMFCKAHQKV